MKNKDFLICNYNDYSARIKELRKKQLASFYNKNFLLSQWSSDYFSNFLNDTNERKMECFVLEKNKNIAGFILGRIVGKIRCRYNLTTLLIDKKYRGKGCSKFLLDEFLKIVRKNKAIKKVYLHFRDSNDFEGFYRHYGFSRHRMSGTYSNGEKKHYMEILINQ